MEANTLTFQRFNLTLYSLTDYKTNLSSTGQ